MYQKSKQPRQYALDGTVAPIVKNISDKKAAVINTYQHHLD